LRNGRLKIESWHSLTWAEWPLVLLKIVANP
jgi:hypothetical protein